MANLRVLVSSTAYDLTVLRASLRAFIQNLGFEPVLSEYSDILYDPRDHTHESCVRGVEQCDMVVLVIGSRLGSMISDDDAQKLTVKMDESALRKPVSSKLSITQAEALTAAMHGIPVFAFVERGVEHDYRIYRRNANESFASNIQYASITKPGTAEYIFSFIEYLQRRSVNNSLTIFDGIDDICEHLQKQWSALFQRLLYESRLKREEAVRIDRLANQFEELKEIFLKTTDASGGKHIARLTMEYRDLVEFLNCLPRGPRSMRDIAVSAAHDWDQLLSLTAGVTSFETLVPRFPPWTTLARRGALQPHVCRLSSSAIAHLSSRWNEFRALSQERREVIFDGISEVLRPLPDLLSPLPQEWAVTDQDYTSTSREIDVLAVEDQRVVGADGDE